MRKLTLLITMLFLSLGMAWAQELGFSTNVGNPEHQYFITNGNNIKMAPNTAPTQNNPGKFAFFEADGDNAYKIYSIGAGQWVSYDKTSDTDNTKNFATLVDSQGGANAWKVTAVTIKGGAKGFHIVPFNADFTTSARYWNWNGGVNVGGGYSFDDTKTVGLWRDAATADAGSGWILTEEVEYSLTDMLGNTYEWSSLGTVGVNPTLPGAAGATFSDGTWDGNKYTATINFPFPVSKEGGVINATTIASFNEDKYWHAVGNDVKVQTNGYDKTNDWLWAIYPKFENGNFSFTIKNLGKNAFVYTTASGSKLNTQGTVALKSEATGFTVELKDGKPCFKYAQGQFLSINSSSDKDVYLGVHTSTHGGTKCHFSLVKTISPVAQIGETAYYTFDEAFAAVQPTQTITLLANYEGAAIELPIGVNLDKGTYTESNVTVKQPEYVYNFVYNDEVKATQQGTVALGTAFPAINAEYKPLGVELTNVPTGNVALSDVDKDGKVIREITVTISGLPFVAAADNASIKNWYYIQMHSYDASNTYNKFIQSVSATEVKWADNSVAAEKQDACTWAFIGNPYDGFKVVNYATGTAIAANGNAPVLNEAGVQWIVTASTHKPDALHFCLKYPNGEIKYLNANAETGALGFWQNPDAGSTMWVTSRDIDSEVTELTTLVNQANDLVKDWSGKVGELTEESKNAVAAAVTTAQAAIDSKKNLAAAKQGLETATGNLQYIEAPSFTGEGTVASPYIINNVEMLVALRDAVNGGETFEGKYFKLTSDIALNGEWAPIGNGSRSSKVYTGNAFKGVFDGDNKTISGLTITSTTGNDAAIGLFGVVDGGTVKNLNLEVDINVATSNLAGGAIGMMLNGATAEGITVSGAVVGNDGVGGIAGRLVIDGTIANCTNNASVTSSYGGIGGIVGKAYYEDGANTATFASITNCTNNGTITAPQYVGGIAGLARANVNECVNNGAIVGGTQTGGIVGQLMAAGTVSANENKAAVSGTNHVGGIIGDYSQSSSYTYNNVSIVNNINRGELSAQQCAAIMGCNNIDGFTAMTAAGNVSYYHVEGLVLFGNPEDMTIDATNKFIVPVAQVGEQTFYTFAEAAAAAQAGSEIKLLADVTLAERVTIPADKTLTIDLNGKSISMEESIIATAYAINNLGNLTITDGVGGGSINARGVYNGYGDGGDNVASATITVSGGTFNAKGTNGGAAIFNYGTANVNGGKFTSIGGYSLNNQAGAKMEITDGVEVTGGIYNNQDAVLTVDGGNISNNRSGCHTIYAWNATVTVNGGSIHNENSGNATILSAGTSEVTINGGTISIKDGRVPGNGNTWTSCLTDAANTAKIIVYGGTFNGGVRVQGGATMTINGGSFNDVAGSGYNVYQGAIVEVKGGTFTDASAQTFAKNNIADDYKVGEDGKVVYAPVVAKIGETKYETLDAAVAAAKEGDKITLLNDADLAFAHNPQFNNVYASEIDLNGNTMTIKEGDIRFDNVTIKNGNIVVEPKTYNGTAIFLMYSKNLTLDGVKVTATGVASTYLIDLEGTSNLNLLNGSEILVDNTTAIDTDIICSNNGATENKIVIDNSKVTVNNIDGRVFFSGNYTVKDSEISLAGISKAGFRINAGQTLSIEGTSKVNIEGEPRDGGIHLTDASANYTKAETATVNATVNEPKVAKIGETTYKTLQAAIEAVQEGETIILVDNVNVTTPAYGQNALNHARAINFTLDLNGKTLSANTGNSVFRFNIANSGATSNVTLTIKNGKIVAGSNTWCAVMASGISSDVKAIMNLENLTIEASKAGDLAVKAWDNATINANNVTVNATNAAGGFYAVGGEIVLDNCTVNQKGLHTAPYLSMAFAVSSNGKMTVNSGTYSAEPTAAAEGSNQGSTHGSWVGGVMNSGGELIINGGTFSNGNFGDDALATAARGLIFADTNGKVTVNGGTFNALKSIFDFQNNLGGTSPVITVKGGNYSADPAEVTSYGSIVLDANYVAVENNGVWTVVKAAAKIDGVAYATLADALEATKTMTGNVTVEILDKVTFNQPLIGNYSSINFVGKAVNANARAASAPEMYLDVQGYTTATGKKVSFTDLKLSKSEGGFIANAGFMNVAFGIYDVEEVTYTNCTFENGAYASSGKVTFNGCTFKKSWDKYGLWAYGNVDVTVQGSTFADYRGIKMYAENGADASVEKANLTVKNTNFSAVDNKPAIVLTYGESVVLEGNTYSSTGTFELDLDGKPNGVAVTSDVLPTCKNDNGACGVLVDGKIYTTVAQAAEVATETSTVKLLHSSNETVEFPMGTTIEKNGFTADNVTTAQPVAVIGAQKFASLQAAIDAVQNGETIILQKDCAEAVTFTQTKEVSFVLDGNNKTYTGSINITARAGKDAPSTLVIKNFNFKTDAIAHDFIKSVETNYYPNNITISNCKFEGTADINTENYAVVAVRLKSANNIKIENCTGSGLHSFLQNTAGWNMQIDNVDVTNSLSGFAMGTIQGAGIKNCDLTVNKSGIRFDAQLNNNAVITDNKINAFIPVVVRKASVESSLTFNGENTMTATNTDGIWFAAGTSEYETNGQMPTAATGKVKVTLNDTGLSAAGVYGDYVPVAKIGDVEYTSLEAAFKAATGGCTIDILSDVTVDYAWDARNTGSKFTVPVTINGNGKTIKFTASVNDNNYQAPFRFEADATVKNLTVDMSEVTDNRFRAISSKGNLTVDGCKFIGKDETLNCRAIIFGEGAGANVGNLAVAITNSEFINWKRGITDNENAQDVKTVTITGNTLTDAGVAVSAYETVTFTGNTVEGAYVDIRSNTANSSLNVTATGNTLEENTDTAYNYIKATGNIDQEGFKVYAVAKIGDAEYTTIEKAYAALQEGDEIVILKKGSYALKVKNNITITGAVDGVEFANIGEFGCNGANVTFNNVTFTYANNSTYKGLQHSGNLVYNNCTFNGQVFLYGQSETFNGCTFNTTDKDNYNVWTYSAKNVAFNECTFNSAGKSVLIYHESASVTNNVAVTKSQFNASQAVEGKAAIEMDSSLSGAISLTIDGETTATGFGTGNVSGNSLWNNKKGNNDVANNDITVKVGDTVVLAPIFEAQIGDAQYRLFQDAIDAVQNGETITVLRDVATNVEIKEKDNVKVTIDGNGMKMTGTIKVVALSSDNDRRITIKNFKFEDTTSASVDFITSVETNHYPRITVEGCTFTGSGDATDVALRLKSSNYVEIKNCTGKGLHSFIQNTSGWNLTIENVTVTESKSAFALGTVQGVTVKGCTVDVPGYGIRMDAGYNNNAVIESNTIKAFIPVVVRKATVNSNIAVNGTNNLTATNNDGIWCAIGTSEYEANGAMPTAATGNVVVALNDADLDSKGIYGNALAGQGTAEAPYLINNIGELVLFRDKVNSGDTKYNAPGVWVALGADVDLAGITWTEGIGDGHNWSFDGNFDGKNHTIKNLTVAPYADDNKYLCGGLFGYIYGGVTIKNLTIENATIEFVGEEGKEYFNVGVLVGFANNNGGKANISDITVKGDIKVNAPNAYGVGAIVGYSYRDMGTITNCTVEAKDGSYIKGYSFVGGITGYSYAGATIADCSVKNIDITATNYSVAGIAGLASANNTVSNCVVEDVTVNGEANVGNVIGAIAANGIVVENCTAAEPLVGGNYSDNKAVEARIGNKYYATLDAALAAEGDEVTLLAPITVAADETLVLDLQGKTVSHSKECTASYQMVNNKGNLTIKNGKLSFTDTGAGDASFGWGSYTVRNEGTLVVEEDATIEHLGAQTFGTHMICAIFQYCGSTTINGGTISTPNYRSARLWKGDMTINGGKFEGQLWVQAVDNTANLVINGGEFAPRGNDGSSVFVTNNQYNVQLAVTGGKFATKIGCSDATKLAGCVTGGSFTQAAIEGTNSALVALGYVFGAADENGYSTLVDDPSTYYIANVEQFVAFRDAVNAGNDFAGVAVRLVNDIDLAGIDWSVNIGDDCSATFDGTFDGQGHTIKNLTSTETAQKADGYICTGLFGAIHGNAVLKNFTIENVNINTGDYTGNNVAAVVGFAYKVSGSIDNVKVTGDININAKNVTGVGAILGYDYYSPALTVNNCQVSGNSGSAILGKSYTGGAVGYASSKIAINNNTIENVNVTATGSVAAVAGIMLAGSSATDNTVKNVAVVATGELWANSAAVVAGTITAGGVNVANTTVENVTANGAAAALVGGQLVEKPTTAIAKVEAKIGDKYYTTLDAALATEGEATVELLAPVTIAKDETVVLDLNGKTVTYTSAVAGEDMITNRGNLTITDSSDAKTGKLAYVNTDTTASNVTVSTISTEAGSTLVVDGGTIENKTVKADGSSIYSFAIDILTNGNLGDVNVTINGGTVYSDYMAIRQFNNGTACKNSLTINGGNIYGAKRAVQVHMDNNAAVTAINGGKVEAGEGGYAICNFAATSDLAVTGGEFIGAVYSARENFISGGIYDAEVYAGYCAEGYMPNKNTNGTYGVVAVTDVYAIIDGVTYGSLKAAVKAAKAGETITLLQDVKENVTISKNLTIDGAGKTITGMITTDGKSLKVTIKNVKFDGDNGTIGYAMRADDNLNLVVENCSASNYLYGLLYANKSNDKIVVKNVTVEGCAEYGAYLVAFNKATFENFEVKGATKYGIAVANAADRNVTLKNVSFENAETPLYINELGTGKVTFNFSGSNEMSKAEFYTSQYVKVVAVAQVGTKVCGSLQDAVVAANDGETVKVLADVNMTTANFVTQVDGYATLVNVAGKAVTIDLNGKKVTVNAAKADLDGKAQGNMLMSVFHADPNGTLTLTDSSAEGTGTVELFANDATVYGLIVSENAYDKSNPGKIIINGGNYIADRLADSMIFADINEVITVNGGNFHLGNVGSSGVNGKPWIFNASGNNQMHINVNGGTYNANVAKQYWTYEVNLGEGLTTTNNGDGTWTVVPAVASVGEELFGSIQEAIDAAQDGETVKLLADVALDTKKSTTQVDNLVVLFNVKGKAVTFDLNGKKIDVNASAANLGGKMLAGVFSADVEGNFTITDSSAEGTGAVNVAVNDANVYSVFISENAGDKTKSGKITVNAGTFTTVGKVANAMIFADTDKVVTINGGTFICDGVSASGNYPWLINTHGNNEKQVTVNGGTFNVDVNHQYRPFEVFVPENLAVKANGNGTWTIVAAQAYVTEMLGAYVNETGTREHNVGYATVAEAIAATNDLGKTVTILAGEYTQNLNVNKAITVKGEVDAEGNNLVTFNGKLSITADGATVENLNFNNSGTAAYVGAKNVTIDGCSLVGSNGLYQSYTSGTVTFKNSYIKGGTYGIHFDGNAGGNIVIENCTVIGWTSFAGTITNVAISGTTFAEGNYNQLRLYQNATITECTFNEKMNIDWGSSNKTGEFNNCSVEGDKELIEILSLSNIVTKGLEVYVDGELISVAAKVNDNYYMSLQEAIDAATVGQTVTILSDIALTEGVTVAADDEIFIDLNGKTVSMETAEAAVAALIKNNGTLTIESSVDGGKLSFLATAPSATNAYASNTISNYGTLTINGGTVENLSAGGACYALDNYAGSTATINGGKLTAEKTAVRVFNWTNGEANAAELNVVGGEIFSNDGYGININAGNAPYVDLNISGGTITTNDTDYNLAVYVVNKNSAENFTANISGGTFNGNLALNGVTSTTMAKGNVSVSGGTFDGVICYGEPAHPFITGGSYMTEFAETYLAWGYQLTGDAAPYTVTETGKRAEVTIVDNGKVAEFVNENDIEVGKLTYTRNFSTTNNQSFYVPFEVPMSMLSADFNVYYISNMHGYDRDENLEIDSLSLEAFRIPDNAVLRANYPYIIHAKNAGTVMNLEFTDKVLYEAVENSVKCSSVFADYEITGVYTRQVGPGDAGDYLLTAGDWQLMGEATNLNAFRLGLKITESLDSPYRIAEDALRSIGVRVIGGENEDGTTSIEGVDAENVAGEMIYDLQGRRVLDPEHGIYIINGKKVFIK